MGFLIEYFTWFLHQWIILCLYICPCQSVCLSRLVLYPCYIRWIKKRNTALPPQTCCLCMHEIEETRATSSWLSLLKIASAQRNEDPRQHAAPHKRSKLHTATGHRRQIVHALRMNVIITVVSASRSAHFVRSARVELANQPCIKMRTIPKKEVQKQKPEPCHNFSKGSMRSQERRL